MSKKKRIVLALLCLVWIIADLIIMKFELDAIRPYWRIIPLLLLAYALLSSYWYAGFKADYRKLSTSQKLRLIASFSVVGIMVIGGVYIILRSIL